MRWICMNKNKILIFGSNGLLGNTIFMYFLDKKINTVGVVRNPEKCILKSKNYLISKSLFRSKNLNKKEIVNIIKKIKPNYVINAIGLTKNKRLNENLFYLINGKFPKFLSSIAKKNKFKLIHFSTDCVYDGSKGNYSENSIFSARDIYGNSKISGEINNKNTVTLRTSMVGHSEYYENGLLEWFLNQKKQIKGFMRMYFTGPTALEIAKIIEKYIINEKIIKYGLYNIGAKKISKYSLLHKFKKIYKKNIKIKRDFKVKIDRSLNLSKFITKTKYKLISWEKLIKDQKKFYETHKKKRS